MFPSGFMVHRASNASWSGNSGTGIESLATVPYRTSIDFDLLGEQFWIVLGGDMGSSGVDSQTWRVRVGGTYTSATDGDIALEQVSTVAAFAAWSVKQLVTNIWSGVHLVKVTGQLAGGGGFTLRPTLFFFPA